MTLQQYWGLQPPEEAKVAWGARAICESRSNWFVDLLPDRQGWIGQEDHPELAKELLDKLNAGALQQVRDAITEKFTRAEWWGNSDDTAIWEFNGVKFAATPRGSCGYVYIVGYLE